MNFNKIKSICETKGLPISVLAEKIGFSEAGLYQSFRNESMKVDILEKIAVVLEVPIWVFFDLNPEAAIEPLKKELEEYKDKVSVQEQTISNLKMQLRSCEELREGLSQIILSNDRAFKLSESLLIQIQKESILFEANIRNRQNFLKLSGVMIPSIDILDDNLKYESPEVQKLLLEYKNSLGLPSGQKGKK
jgi:transcriptional regulator with XRE-family HTH domain